MTNEIKKRRNLYQDIKVLSDYFDFLVQNKNDINSVFVTELHKEAKAIVDFHATEFQKRNGFKTEKLVAKVNAMTKEQKEAFLKSCGLL